MLSLWRRHESNCPHASKGRAHLKCNCPIWCDGEINGGRVRKSLETRDWTRATRSLAKLEDPSYGMKLCTQPGCPELVERGRCAQHSRDIERAVAAYHATHQDVSEGTKRNRRRTLRFFQEFILERGVKAVDVIDLEAISSFRTIRAVSARTWTKELEILRHFFRFCLDNDWIVKNWAARVPMPKNLKPAPREPYTYEEIAKILAACDEMGRAPYERLRARDDAAAALHRSSHLGRCGAQERSHREEHYSRAHDEERQARSLAASSRS